MSSGVFSQARGLVEVGSSIIWDRLGKKILEVFKVVGLEPFVAFMVRDAGVELNDGGRLCQEKKFAWSPQPQPITV